MCKNSFHWTLSHFDDSNVSLGDNEIILILKLWNFLYELDCSLLVPWHEFHERLHIKSTYKNEKAHQSRKKNHSIVSGLLFSFFLHSHWNERENKEFKRKATKRVDKFLRLPPTFNSLKEEEEHEIW